MEIIPREAEGPLCHCTEGMVPAWAACSSQELESILGIPHLEVFPNNTVTVWELGKLGRAVRLLCFHPDICW